MPLEKPDLYVIDEGVVISAAKFDVVISCVKKLLEVHPVIIIPKEIFDPSQFKELIPQGHVAPMVNDCFDGAAPHDHDEPSCLVSDGSTRTSTLIFNARGAAEGTLELLHAGWKSKIEELIGRSPPDWKYKQRFDQTVRALTQHVKNPSLAVRNVHQDHDERWSLEQIRSIVSNLTRSVPGARDILHQFVVDVQDRVKPSTREILWQETGLLMFHGDMIHGRDVTKFAQRGPDEGLFMVRNGVRSHGSY